MAVAITGIRSGTSMMMQTLKILGFPVVGKKFPWFYPPELNKKGYWEFDFGEYINGVPDRRFCGSAVKLAGRQLVNSPHVSKLIVCQRNKKDCIKSINTLVEQIKAQMGFEVHDITPEEIYDTTFATANNCAKQINTCFVRFENMLYNPKREINKIVNFLELNTNGIERAIDNIK